MNEAEKRTTRIAKDFHWEMGHRLPFHNGGCQNIHGHSYRMRVTVEGDLDENGMVLDYFDLKEIVEPLVARIDHSFLCDDRDEQMLEFFRANPLKHVVVPFRTTAENLAQWFLTEIADRLASYPNLRFLTVRVHETERTYAERSGALRDDR
jgi:6-pyruvoyltetrahydropterin/6-carboxytetrahydropterin synthase